MSNVRKLETTQHVYNVEECSGCQKPILEGDDYQEIGLPSPDGKEVTHIKLCSECFQEASNHNIF